MNKLFIFILLILLQGCTFMEIHVSQSTTSDLGDGTKDNYKENGDNTSKQDRVDYL